jgi:hypothetical protein
VKQGMLSVALSVALLIGAGSAYAGSKNRGSKDQASDDQTSGDQGSRDGRPKAVPEIDATSGIPAIAFVLGVSLLGAERLRRRSERAS